MKRHTFRTGTYRLVTNEQLAGLCMGPSLPNEKPDYFIWVDPRMKGKDKLDTIIHECIHAHDPKATEEYVARLGTDVAEVLWKLGYRERP